MIGMIAVCAFAAASHRLNTKRSQSSQLNGLHGPALGIIEYKTTPAVDLNSGRGFYMKLAVSGQSEFQHQVEFLGVHYLDLPSNKS